MDLTVLSGAAAAARPPAASIPVWSNTLTSLPAGQRIFVIRREDHVYLVPSVEDKHRAFPETSIFPGEETAESRPAEPATVTAPPAGAFVVRALRGGVLLAALAATFHWMARLSGPVVPLIRVQVALVDGYFGFITTLATFLLVALPAHAVVRLIARRAGLPFDAVPLIGEVLAARLRALARRARAWMVGVFLIAFGVLGAGWLEWEGATLQMRELTGVLRQSNGEYYRLRQVAPGRHSDDDFYYPLAAGDVDPAGPAHFVVRSNVPPEAGRSRPYKITGALKPVPGIVLAELGSRVSLAEDVQLIDETLEPGHLRQAAWFLFVVSAGFGLVAMIALRFLVR